MALLTWEDGLVKIDGQELPGLLVDQSVDGKVKFDEQDVDGQSGKKRTPLGWEDMEVSLTLALTTESRGTDCYEKLEIINGIFRGHDDQANPKVYDVDNRHLAARGVGRLIFASLGSAESDRDDMIVATLGFVENNPPVVRTETKVARAALDLAKKDQALALAAQSPPKPPAVNPGPGADAGVEVDLR